MVLAGAAGACASFSSAMGLLVWPAGVVIPALHRFRGTVARRGTLLWLGTGGLVWFFYFVGYVSPPHHASILDALREPVRLIDFFLTLCGLWAADSSGGAAFGAACLVGVVLCCVSLWRRGELARYAVWVSLIVFCLLTLAMIAAGRSTTPEIAYRSAYATYSAPVAAGLVALLAGLGRGSGDKRISPLALLAMLAIAVGTVHGLVVGKAIGSRERSARTSLAELLVDYQNRSDAQLALLYPPTEKVRPGADFLAAHRWSVFAANGAAPRRLSDPHYYWGDALRLGAGGNARPYLADGWSVDEQGFVWGLDPSALVRMEVGEQPRPLRLELTHAMVQGASGQVASQRVIVCVAGDPVGEFVATGTGHVAVDLATPALPAGVFELELRFPDAAVSTELGIVGDKRRLAVAVAGLRLAARN
jgi:hypothetical protein